MAESSSTKTMTIEQRQLRDQLGIDGLHGSSGDGNGIRVAILDTGFRGWRQHLGDTLPSRVTTKSFRTDGNLEARDSIHGIMCAETIHTLAPRAELFLVNWEPDNAESFLDAVRYCRQQKVHIVSCSVVTPAWSDGDGGGAIHAELARIIGDGTSSGDMIAIACAGNLAQRHWHGEFADDGRRRHRWNNRIIWNTITPWGSDPVSIELCQSDESQFDLEIEDAVSRRLIGQRRVMADESRRCVVVRFVPERGRRYRIAVKNEGDRGGKFHLSSLGAWMECFTQPSSIPFPGDGAEWLTVGAIDANGVRMPYSSCGPIAGRNKPDLAAVVPIPTGCRSDGFSGTSAAAPQAAGLAAIGWSLSPRADAATIRRELLSACIDVGPPGNDPETGRGKLRMPPIRRP